MKLIIDYLKDVNEKKKTLDKRFSDAELVFAYRGESKDYGTTKLMPSLYRGSGEDVSIVEKKLLESLSDYGVSHNNKSLLKMAIDSQHYIAKSRLLDVSFNALNALFFSLVSDKVDEDFAYVYVIGTPKEIVFSPNSRYLSKLFDEIVYGDNKNILKENIKLIMHSVENERIIAQDGGFLLFPGNEFLAIPHWYYERVPIELKYRNQYLEALNDYFNITISKIYPEKSYKGMKINIDISKRVYHDDDVLTE